MKHSITAKTTTNNRAYNLAIKRVRESKGDIYCSHCRYHKGENFTGSSYWGRPTSWKDSRNTQYKTIL